MCLSPEFFDQREALVRRREAEGDLELEHFLELQGLTIDELYRLGLLEDERECLSTADLFVHQITPPGRPFMDPVEDSQLIFVRWAEIPGFVSFLSRAKAGRR